MRTKLIAGNWKMNGSLDSNAALITALMRGLPVKAGVELAVCVPHPYLAQACAAFSDSRVSVGAQNVSEHAKGAYTGEVSAAMLRDFNCKYVIVGHSERRSLYGETDAIVAEKFLTASSAGLTPILCVGETLQEREDGVTGAVVVRQLDAVLERCGVACFGEAVIAYEPVWAIGTGLTATPEQAQAVHALIRDRVAKYDVRIAEKVQILYGGSMKPSNASELLNQPDIDGGLIGGASLVAEDFLSIALAA